MVLAHTQVQLSKKNEQIELNEKEKPGEKGSTQASPFAFPLSSLITPSTIISNNNIPSLSMQMDVQ